MRMFGSPADASGCPREHEAELIRWALKMGGIYLLIPRRAASVQRGYHVEAKAH